MYTVPLNTHLSQSPYCYIAMQVGTILARHGYGGMRQVAPLYNCAACIRGSTESWGWEPMGSLELSSAWLISGIHVCRMLIQLNPGVTRFGFLFSAVPLIAWYFNNKFWIPLLYTSADCICQTYCTPNLVSTEPCHLSCYHIHSVGFPCFHTVQHSMGIIQDWMQ